MANNLKRLLELVLEEYKSKDTHDHIGLCSAVGTLKEDYTISNEEYQEVITLMESSKEYTGGIGYWWNVYDSQARIDWLNNELLKL